MVEVRLFATLRENREKILYLPYLEFPNAQSILDSLRIDPKDVAILLINGRHSKPIDEIHDMDIVALFPPVGGG